MATALSYVVSPDRERQLFRALGTALRWSEGIDQIVIFCVGTRPANWRFADPRIEVREVASRTGNYFHGNKSWVCTVDCDRLLFLDADTLVLAPLNRLWSGWSSDFRARPANAGFGPRWKHEVWVRTFRDLHAHPLPMFNTGLLLFQNRAHLRIGQAWDARIADYRQGRLDEPIEIDGYFADQWGLSLAISPERLSWSILGPSDHCFGWLGEPHAGSIVLHTSSEDDHFDRWCEQLSVEIPRTLLL